MINPNIIISIPNIIEILNDIINTKTTTNALHNNLINLASNSITLSVSLYNLLINSPTPIFSNAIAGKLSIFLYKSLLAFFINFISK